MKKNEFEGRACDYSSGTWLAMIADSNYMDIDAVVNAINDSLESGDLVADYCHVEEDGGYGYYFKTTSGKLYKCFGDYCEELEGE